jgi:hypothetical protein
MFELLKNNKIFVIKIKQKTIPKMKKKENMGNRIQVFIPFSLFNP